MVKKPSELKSELSGDVVFSTVDVGLVQAITELKAQSGIGPRLVRLVVKEIGGKRLAPLS